MPSSLPNGIHNGTLKERLEKAPLLPVVKLRNTHLATASALLYVVVVGMVTSYSAPATVDMQKPGSRFRNITANQITWIASLPLFAGVFGNALSGYVIQKFGRKAVMIFLSAFFVSSWLFIAYAQSVAMIYAGRVICGICAGMSCVAVPTYIAEIAPAEIRGLLSSGVQLAITIGVFLVMALGVVLRWSWLAISGAVLATCAVCLMVIMPESPPWLVRNSRTPEALAGLKFLKGKRSDLKKDLQDITDLPTLRGAVVTWREFKDPSFYKPLLIGVFLMFFQQSSGVSALISYTVEIFKSTGSSVDPNLAAVIVAAVQVLATALSCVLMDISGRRRLYITSGSCMTVCLVILGLYSYLSQKYVFNVQDYGWIPLGSLIGYIVSFSLGVGPVPFVVTPELVPIHSRSTVVAISSMSCTFFAFIVTKVFEDMRTNLGLYGTYWTYGFFTFLSAIFGFFFLPETRGMTLNQIHRSFSVPNDSL